MMQQQEISLNWVYCKNNPIEVNWNLKNKIKKNHEKVDKNVSFGFVYNVQHHSHICHSEGGGLARGRMTYLGLI